MVCSRIAEQALYLSGVFEWDCKRRSPINGGARGGRSSASVGARQRNKAKIRSDLPEASIPIECSDPGQSGREASPPSDNFLLS